MALGEAVVDVTANTSRFGADVNRKVTGALAGVSSQLRQVGRQTSATGRTLTKSLTLPIVGVGVAGVRMAQTFESNLAKITGLVGVPREQVQAWEGDVRSLAKEFGKSAGEASNALFFITSAGLEGSDAMDALEASLKASAVGLGDTATIADLVTSAMNAYGPETLNAASATDVLTAAVREGKLEPAELSSAMGQVLPIASAMGVSFDQVGATLASMSRTGTNASQASTQLRSIMTSLLKPTVQAEEALEGMGLSSAGLRQQVKDKGLLSVLQTLSKEFEGNDEAAAQVFGNVRALSGVMDLMGSNAEGTAEIFNAMTDTTGSLDNAFSETAETSAFQMSQAMAEIKDLGLELGQAILPVLADVLDGIRSVVGPLLERFQGMSPATRTMIVVIAGLVAALGPLLMILGALITSIAAVTFAIGFISLPVVAVIAGIGALVAALIFLWNTNEGFRAAIMQAWEQIKMAVGVAVEFVSQVVRTLVQNILAWWDEHGAEIVATVMGFWEQVKDIFDAAVDAVTGFVKFAVNAIQRFWDGFAGPFIGSVKRLWDNITRMVAQVWNGITQFISGVLEIIKGIFNVFAGIFTGDWNRAWQGIKSIFAGIWRAIIGLFKAVWATIQGVVRNALEIVRTIINAAFNAIRVLISGAWNAVVTMVTNAWRHVVDAVKSGIADTMGEIRTIQDAITGFFSGAKDWLVDAGKRILQGLADGIKNAISAPVDAVKDAVSAVRKFLPFSPAKIGPLSGRGSPDRAGRMIGRMLASGIADSRRDLERAMVGALAPAGNMRALDIQRGATAERVDRSVRNDITVEVTTNSDQPHEVARVTALAVRAELAS